MSDIFQETAGRRREAHTSLLSILHMDFTEFFGMASSDIEALPKYRKRVREREAACLCLGYDEQADGTRTECGEKMERRGRCLHHYHRFRMDKLGTAKTRRKTFEDNLILHGELLPSRQGLKGQKKPRKTKAA